MDELHHVLRTFILGSERSEGIEALSISEQCGTSLFPNTGDIGKQLIRTDLGINGWELQPGHLESDFVLTGGEDVPQSSLSSDSECVLGSAQPNAPTVGQILRHQLGLGILH